MAEKLKEIVQSIPKAKDVNLQQSEFSCFRAINKSVDQSKQTKPPRIVVTLSNNITKNELTKRPGTPLTLASIGFKVPDTDEKSSQTRIFINENLPPAIRQLFWRVRIFKKANKFRYAGSRTETATSEDRKTPRSTRSLMNNNLSILPTQLSPSPTPLIGSHQTSNHKTRKRDSFRYRGEKEGTEKLLTR